MSQHEYICTSLTIFTLIFNSIVFLCRKVHFIIVIISQNIPSHELFKLKHFFEIYLIRQQVHTVTPYQDKKIVILNAHKRILTHDDRMKRA